MAASAHVRVLVQRVSSARVVVDGDVVGEIRPGGQGLLALVGVTHTDDEDVARRMAEKLWQLRILDGETSAADVAAPILVVSQFTLYADTRKGRRPSWNAAAPGPVAEPLVDEFAAALHDSGPTCSRECSEPTWQLNSSTTDPSRFSSSSSARAVTVR
jgi:D-tyrosyl-tRNA(Tyr) deacylase